MNTHPLWTLNEDRFQSERQHHQETIFTTGNGYLSTRGTFEEGYPGEVAATFIHGVFDDAPVVSTELVNVPNWTSLEIRLAGERFSLAEGQLLSYQRTLDLSNGELKRHLLWRSPQGRTVDIVFQRFASLTRPHLVCMDVAVRPIDFSGEIEVRVPLNGYEDTLGMLHWEWMNQLVEQDRALLHLKTRRSHIELAMAVRLAAIGASDLCLQGWDVKNHPVLLASWKGEAGETVTLEKQVSFFTSRDTPDPETSAYHEIATLELPAWDLLERENRASWVDLWSHSDVVIEGDDESQRSLRFNLFHLLIAAPRQDERVSIGAKTLSGYGYRGHVFWDTEIFILPFFTYTQPSIARNLLSYRWHTLPEARKKAHQNGYSGAQYAWESAATGEEVTPTWLIHPTDRTQLVRIWTGDIEIHVSADTAYALMQYWETTGDDAFMSTRGAEMILCTARFWASRAEWVAEHHRYEFTNVIGPDENHDRIDNNAYTNYMARWHLLTAIELYQWLQQHHPSSIVEFEQRLRFSPIEIERWQSVTDKIYLPLDPGTGLIEQFDGYLNLTDISLPTLEPRFRSVQSLLGIEGAARTQVIKQPDVLMLFRLFPDMFDRNTFQVNYQYYTARTDHTYGSSLGPSIQAILAAWMGYADEAFEHFSRAARADLYDVRGNAKDGIHGASAGGLWQAVVFGFAGLKVTADSWKVEPRLPAHWKRLSFKFLYRGQVQQVDIHNPS